MWIPQRLSTLAPQRRTAAAHRPDHFLKDWYVLVGEDRTDHLGP
jgi:hypothetical protein